MRKTVFLDRDGVINIDHGYVHTPEQFEFVPGVLEACHRLVEAGFQLIVVTNQSGIARGYYDEAQFAKLTEWMQAQFAQAGAPLTAVYYCPHHPEKGIAPYVTACDCRKPEPGMLLRGKAEHQADMAQSYMVGDKADDMTAGKSAGVKAKILVESGKSVTERGIALADQVCPALPQAVEWILSQDD
ncbi:D-glycero-beta-D-manno-heptose 1,7-bisphosphate 7-phosphatase [Ferrimonas marina]|uniref:D,D-heptose 1,7-bisphosphate phosphatase n=1 Tax=Ferrimonas marina TaxID=299255 RepID=A0A1M5YWT2_9GAMM|nr:D-glycero-beta-D-manno-heptose 1,7-bisphosphate 7-phosphatase [Ferrimonas marina]SHI16324.1 D-glycero-D-manno-heptose 1,7-bisphosphate phosphatase [Ferrimonas marina]